MTRPRSVVVALALALAAAWRALGRLDDITTDLPTDEGNPA